MQIPSRLIKQDAVPVGNSVGSVGSPDGSVGSVMGGKGMVGRTPPGLDEPEDGGVLEPVLLSVGVVWFGFDEEEEEPAGVDGLPDGVVGSVGSVHTVQGMGPRLSDGAESRHAQPSSDDKRLLRLNAAITRVCEATARSCSWPAGIRSMMFCRRVA